MVVLAYRKILGMRVRQLRELHGWSQAKAAGRVPLSQKQWSRLELGDISFIDRALIIRLAEILETPVATGELNQWLHAFGYRPHMMPLLPLPPDYQQLLAHQPRLPAVIIDLGRYLRYINPPMSELYNQNLGDLRGVARNWLWQYFHPNGFLYHAYPPDSEERVLNQLFWDWQPYYQESWNVMLRHELEESLGVAWADLKSRYDIPSERLTGPLSEIISVRGRDGIPLLFQNQTVTIPFRPDLCAILYRPVNQTARQWCRLHNERRQHA